MSKAVRAARKILGGALIGLLTREDWAKAMAGSASFAAAEIDGADRCWGGIRWRVENPLQGSGVMRYFVSAKDYPRIFIGAIEPGTEFALFQAVK